MKRPFLTLLVFVFTTVPAAAICVAGLGNSCPPSDDAIQKQLREQIDGKSFSNHRIKREIYQFVMPSGTVTPQMLDQIRSEISNTLIPFTLSHNEQCDRVLDYLPSAFKGPKVDPASFINPCKFAKRLISAGLMTLESKESNAWGTRKIDILLKPTPTGEDLIKKTLVDRTGDPLANLENWLQVTDFVIYVDNISFGRILRKSEPQTMGPYTISEVQFTYRVVPNEWALRTPQERTGTAVFQKWSDGWRIAGPPNL